MGFAATTILTIDMFGISLGVPEVCYYEPSKLISWIEVGCGLFSSIVLLCLGFKYGKGVLNKYEN